MFGLFKKKKPECPIDEDMRVWIESAFLWLKNHFGTDFIKNKRVLIPDAQDFPIVFDGEYQSAIDALQIVAKQMDTDFNIIELKFYSEGITEVTTGNSKIFIAHEKNAQLSSGKYHGMNENGIYEISIEEKNLKDPVGLIATLAHEIAHIKLLGENRIDKNNEHLTDLLTIIYGLGIFNANASFRFSSGYDQWGYQKIGYLTQIEWGYALAVYAHLKEEPNPTWINYLSETVKGTFKRSQRFINFNMTN